MRIKQAPPKTPYKTVQFQNVKPGTVFRMNSSAGTHVPWRFLKILDNSNDREHKREAIWLVSFPGVAAQVGQLTHFDPDTLVIVVDAELTLGDDL